MKITYFLVFWFFCAVQGFLSQSEWEIYMNLVKATYVRNSIISHRKVSDGFVTKALKELSREEVFTVFLKPEDLRNYLEKTDMRVFRWTSVVLKENTLENVDYFQNKSIISSYFWIIFDSSNGTLKQQILQIEIPFDSSLLLIEKLANGHYILLEYYKIKKMTPGILRGFGEWKNGSFKIVEKDWFDRKSNMQKYEFVTVKFNEDLYLTPKDKVNEAIWKEMSRILNFTIKNKVVEYSIENGHMDLEQEDEEALLDTQIYLGNKEKYVYLLGPTSQTKLFMHVKVSGEDPGFSRILKPFSKSTWISIGFWVFCLGVAVCFIEYLLGVFGHNKKKQVESKFMFFLPLYSLCNQSGLDISKNLASRFILFVIRASGNIIFCAYGATFISYLLLFIPKLPFTNLKDFIEDGTYKIEGERNSDADTYFCVSNDPLERLVCEKFLSDVKTWSRFDKAVDRMCSGEKLVLVGYDDEIDKYKPCNIVKIKNPLKVVANGFKIRFRSPFRGILHIKLLLMRNTGILQRVNKQIITSISRKFQRNDAYEIHIEKVLSVFLLLFIGFKISVLILIIEICIWKFSKLLKKRHYR